jgi:hypothetical protein
MILAKKDPVGLDYVISLIQKAVHDAFDVKWNDGVDEHGIICYPRCYATFKRRNKETIYGQQTIEYFDTSDVDTNAEYIDTNTDYRDVLDGEQNRMLFITDYDTFEVNSSGNYESSFFECIFVVNLNKTNPTIKHRADEEVRLEVKKVISKIPNITIQRSVRSINKVFGDLRYSTTLDMHPMHCFKFIISADRFTATNKIC